MHCSRIAWFAAGWAISWATTPPRRDNAIPPDMQATIDWETPATINDTWGFKTQDHNWKSTTQLLRNLVDIVSKGGNYLLNIGPDAEGAIPEPSIERLEAMGAWLDAHGEAIYGSEPGPIQGLDWCRTTRKGDAGLPAHLRLARQWSLCLARAGCQVGVMAGRQRGQSAGAELRRRQHRHPGAGGGAQ